MDELLPWQIQSQTGIEHRRKQDRREQDTVYNLPVQRIPRAILTVAEGCRPKAARYCAAKRPICVKPRFIATSLIGKTFSASDSSA